MGKRSRHPARRPAEVGNALKPRIQDVVHVQAASEGQRCRDERIKLGSHTPGEAGILGDDGEVSGHARRTSPIDLLLPDGHGSPRQSPGHGLPA